MIALRHITSLSIAVTAYALIIGSAHAELPLKKRVFSDCASVEREATALDGKAREEFVDYLGRILELDSSALQALFAESGAGASLAPGIDPRASFKDITNFPAVETEREVTAKRCALAVLNNLGTAAHRVLPELFEFSQQSTVPHELRLRAADVLWKSTTEHEENPERNANLAFLLEELGGDRSWLAEHLLVQMHTDSLPYLLRQTREADSKVRSRIAQLVLRIDPMGTLLAAALPALLQSADEDLRLRGVQILSGIRRMTPELLQLLIARVSDGAESVRTSAIEALEHVATTPERLEPGELSPASVQAIVREYRSGNVRVRDALIPVFPHLAKGSTEIQSELIAAARADSDEDLRVRTIHILALLNDEKGAIFDQLRELLFDRSAQVRVAAILALKGFRSRGEDVNAALMSVLKSAAQSKDSAFRESAVLAAAEVVSQMDRVSGVERILPYFIDALAYRSIHSDGAPVAKESLSEPLFVAFEKIGPDAIAPLMKALRQGGAPEKVRVLKALKRFPPLDRKAIRELFALLSDTETAVRNEALTTIDHALQPEWNDELVRAMKNAPVSRKLLLALLTLKRGVEVSASQELLNGTVPKLSCGDLREMVDFLEGTSARGLPTIPDALLSCLERRELTLLQNAPIFVRLAPLSPASGDRLWAILQGDTFGAQERLESLKILNPTAIDRPRSTALALQILTHGENAAKQSAIQFLRSTDIDSPEIQSKVVEIFEDHDQERALRGMAAAVIVEKNIDRPEARQYLLDILKKDQSRVFESALELLSAERRRVLLTGFIPEVTGDRRALLLRKLGLLGVEGVQSISEILPYADEDYPSVRYAATVALLRIQPENEVVPRLLRREFRERFFSKLMGEQFESSAAVPLRSVLQGELNFEERLAAEQLLRNIERMGERS